MIEACKIDVRGSISGHTCACKGKFFTKESQCNKVDVSCSTKCHSELGPCINMRDLIDLP